MTLPHPAGSRAVLVGVSTYTELEGLPTVANNLDGMERLLTGPESWGLEPKHCVVLSDPESDVKVLDAVRAAAQEATDALLVYFAGHGLPSPEMSLYLGLPNSHLERLYDAVDYAQLRRQLVHECRAPRRVVILDCCYGGMAMRGYMGPELPLADLTGIDGTYLLTASSATKTAMAPEDETYTAFTGELLKAAVEGVPDGPEILDMGAVFTHVRRELQGKDRPVPQQWARDLGQHIALTRNQWTPAPGPEAYAYATALREVIERAGADEGRLTARETPPTLVRRYLSGQRVAPREFVDALAAHGVVLPEADLTRLHALRRAAQRAAPNTPTQLLYWQEEVDLLQHRLEHAGRYSHSVGSELEQAQEQVRLLREEVQVLRGQVRQLLDDEVPARTGVLVGVAAQSTGAPVEEGTDAAPTPEGDSAVTGTAAPGATTAPASDTSFGGCLVVIPVVAAVIYTLIMWALSAREVSLVYDSGRKPASIGVAQVWDVADSVESTLRPADTGETDRLLGKLTVTVSEGCTDRTVRWEVAVDGTPVRHGSVTGKEEHQVPVEYDLKHTPGKVTLSARWDGGTGSCDSFGVVWDDPRLSRSFEFHPW